MWWVVGATAIFSGICGAGAHGLNGLVQGISIIVAAILIIFVTSFADYTKDKRFISLQSMIKEQNIPVLRGKYGATKYRSVWDLVVGDIILLSQGDQVPADCLIIN